jgi:hypothetical protein
VEATVAERLDDLEQRLAEIAGGLARLEQRVAALETSGVVAPSDLQRRQRAAAKAAATLEHDGTAALGTFMQMLQRGGYTLLALAGGFLLRSLTDSGRLPPAVGVALGFAYAGLFVALADRAGGKGKLTNAGFYAASATLIGFPLLYEATVRLQLLSVPVASTLLVAFSAGELAVAARRKMQGLGWIISFASVATAIGLMVVTGRMVPPTLALLAIGGGLLWLGYLRDWYGPRWPVAIVLDVVYLVLAARSVAPSTAEGPGLVLVAQGLLVVVYLSSFAARTLFLGRDVVTFEAVQTAGVLLSGMGGAAFVAARSGVGTAGFFAASVVLGVAAYAVAFAFLEHRKQGRANFYFYSSVGLVFVLLGTGLFLPDWATALTWAALAAVVGTIARLTSRRTLTVHAVVLAVGAAAWADLLLNADRTLFTSAAVPWPPLPPAALLVLVFLAAATWSTALGPPRITIPERVTQFVITVVTALALAGAVSGFLAEWLGPPGPEANLGFIATSRTAILSGAGLLAAWLGRREAAWEVGWLAWPLLLVGGLKILMEDLSRGTPATLIVSFACYGAALIIVPRLRARRAGAAAPGAPAGGTA